LLLLLLTASPRACVFDKCSEAPLMANSWFSCKPCVGSDPTQDTVKVNPNLLLAENPNKENLKPVTRHELEQERERDAKEKQLTEERRKQAEAEARRCQEQQIAAEEARVRQETKKAAEEKQRQEEQRLEDEAYKAAALASIAAATVAAQEQRVRQEAQRIAEEQAKREREAAEEVAEHAAALDKVNSWCKSNGYQDMNTQKKTLRGATKFPLHTAVKHKNEEMIGLLLKCGVDKNAHDSRKQTAVQLAEKMKEDGILAMLR
jgi:membrane protein involved in colicin uptake